MSARRPAAVVVAIAWGFALAVVAAGPARGQAGPPPSSPADDECRAFAETMRKAVTSGDTAAVTDALDWDAILETATAGVKAPEATRKAFSDGVKKSAAG